MHGLKVLAKTNLCQSVRRPALRMQTTSAWAVGSPVWTRKLCPREMILPSKSARTAPIGMPPSDNPSLASAMASASRPFSFPFVRNWFHSRARTRAETQNRRCSSIRRPVSGSSCISELADHVIPSSPIAYNLDDWVCRDRIHVCVRDVQSELQIIVLPLGGPWLVAQRSMVVSAHGEQAVAKEAVVLRRHQRLYPRICGYVLYFVMNARGTLGQIKELGIRYLALHGLGPLLTALGDQHLRASKEICPAQAVRLAGARIQLLHLRLRQQILEHLQLAAPVQASSACCLSGIQHVFEFSQNGIAHRSPQ